MPSGALGAQPLTPQSYDLAGSVPLPSHTPPPPPTPTPPTPPYPTPTPPRLQAVELGLDRRKRLSLRRRLRAARATCPLFDTRRWVADFQLVLLRMWEIHCEGRGPRDFEVEPSGGPCLMDGWMDGWMDTASPRHGGRPLGEGQGPPQGSEII